MAKMIWFAESDLHRFYFELRRRKEVRRCPTAREAE